MFRTITSGSHSGAEKFISPMTTFAKAVGHSLMLLTHRIRRNAARPGLLLQALRAPPILATAHTGGLAGPLIHGVVGLATYTAPLFW